MSDCLYQFGEFVLDAGERVICRAGKPVALTPKAFDLLVTLVEQHGRLVGKEELLSRLWPDTFVEETNLTYNMSMLRKALGDSSEQSALIETVPKRGYRFVAAVSTTPKNAVRQSRRRALAWAGVAVATLLLAAGGWRVAGRHRRGMDSQGRSLVLVAEFQNRTGDPDLDGVLETALEAELAQASYLGITPRERANDALRLMRRPPASRVPAALAREVCLRDPAIRAAITGNIHKIGATYLLVAEIIRPADGSVVSSITRSAADKNAILSAVRGAAAVFRDRLGEELPGRDAKQPSLEKVTTDSLPALKLTATPTHWRLRTTGRRRKCFFAGRSRSIRSSLQRTSASLGLSNTSVRPPGKSSCPSPNARWPWRTVLPSVNPS